MLLALLDARPHVTVGDLYALSRYLFNLSNAVKQARGGPVRAALTTITFIIHDTPAATGKTPA